MSSRDPIKSYVAVVCEQIRWKKAHARIAEEMENHIVDQRDSLIAQGLDKEAATDKAIANTGDAVAIGAQLDRTHRPKPQWTMLGATVMLLLLGIFIKMFLFNDEDRTGLMSERLLYTGIGIIGLLLAYFADFSLLGKYPKTVYGMVAAFSLAVLCVSPVINGQSRFTQYIILLFPLAFALIVYAARNKGYMGILLSGLALVIQCGITLMIPSISWFLHYAVMGLALLSLALSRNWFGVKRAKGFLILLAPMAVLGLVCAATVSSYHRSRLAVALNPSLDPEGMGYWSIMTGELLRGAALFGQGSIPESYRADVMEPHPAFYTDSLLTAVISLAGWVAFGIILGAILFFIVKGFILCFRQRSGLGFMVSISIMMTFSAQAISYVAFNLGLQFASPLSLPLISPGSGSTIINLVLIGFMLSVFRTGDAVTDRSSSLTSAKDPCITWDNGTLTVHFKPR